MSDVTTTAPTTRWWAPGPHDLPLRTRLAAAALALALIAVVVLVWRTPGQGSPAERGGAAAVASGSTAQEARLRTELAQLRQEIAEQERAAAEAPPPEVFAPAVPTPEDEDDDAARRPRRQLVVQPPAPRSAPRALAPRPPASPPANGPANPRNPQLPGRDAVGPDPAGPTPAAPSPGPQPTPEPPAAPARAELLDPGLRYYGMYTVQSPFNWAELDLVASRTGRLPSLAGYFSGWDKEFRDDAVVRSWQRGMLPMLTWESRPSGAANDQRTEAEYALPRILEGAHDEYLHAYARAITELGLPLAIRFDHEMNGDWYPWSEIDKEGDPINGNRPGDFAAVWRHVHDIFEAEGANEHVIWVWSPNRVDNLPDPLKTREHLERLYPGDEYVDWIGMSGYHRPPYRPDQVPTFDYIFDRTLDQLRALTDKPILLSEVGASEVGGQKAEWITSVFDGLTRPENDDVVGLAWFNLTVTSTVRGELVTNDWRVNSSGAALEAFAAGLRDPAARMGGTPYGENPSAPPTVSRPGTGAGDGTADDEVPDDADDAGTATAEEVDAGTGDP